VSIDGLRYIDTCEFWKDQYTKIHLENRALQDKVHRLEQLGEHKLLECPRDQAIHDILQVSSNPSLAEPGTVGGVENEASRKRPAQIGEDRPGYQEQTYVDFSSEQEDVCLSMSKYGKPVAQSSVSSS